ncbi:DUF1361 domain-containing protein [Enterococcus sp. LJL99]
MFFVANKFELMALNVFLAYIPIEFSYQFKNRKNKTFMLILMGWVLFYPNAPYLLTDFFHLEELHIYQGVNGIFALNNVDWFYFCLMTLGICIYSFLGMQTIFSVADELQKRGFIKNNYQTLIFYFGINFLSGLAIFVGRFDRLHSVYLFTRPFETISLVFFEWSVSKFIFIMIFTFFQFALLIFLDRLKSRNK